MSDKEKFEVFKQQMVKKNEARYGRELREKYGGETMDQSNARILSLTEAEYAQWKTLNEEILSALSEAVQRGQDPAGPEGQRIAALHRRWLSCFWETYTPKAHAGLGLLYTADPRFTAYYDREAPGCAAFLQDAIGAYVKSAFA